MTKQSHEVTVVQHLAFENLGSFKGVLRELGFEIREVQAGVDDVASSMAEAELLIVLGGPIGVYETDAYPFLLDEVSALSDRLARRRPTLGICLGAQLMARALGARVYPGGQKEIGWSELMIPEAGRESPLRHLAGTPVLHWHGDTFDMPEGCSLLASSPLYPHQAFDLGPNVLGLQFHPEVLTSRFECWLIGHAAELSQAGVDVMSLRAEAQRYGAALERVGQAMFHEWLSNLAWS